MKSTVIWVTRHLLIPVAFIFWAAGGSRIFHYTPMTSNGKTMGSHIYTDEDFAKLECHPDNVLAYGDSLYALRTWQLQVTGKYDPRDYFRDLRQFEMFDLAYQQILNKQGDRKMILINATSGFGHSKKSKLVNLFQSYWRNESSEESYVYMEKVRAEIFHEKPTEPINWIPDFWIPILHWLLHFYLRGLPIAFVMFLIWRLKLRRDIEDEYRYQTEKPSVITTYGITSLILSIIVWPVVLGIDLRNRFSNAVQRAQVLTTRQKMLTVFSKTEEQILQAGKTMTIREFRKYLDSLGLQKNHSFWLAFVVMIILTFLPKLTTAKTSCNANGYSTVYVNPDYGGPDIQDCDVWYYDAAILTDSVCSKEPDSVHQRFMSQDMPLQTGFYPDIGVVPKLVITSSQEMIY